ncbi:MAG: SRPBCC family protein [Planctomycetota bacterium]
MGLTIRQHAVVDGPAEAVWPRVADPERMLDWHPKLIAVDRTATGQVTAGERFLLAFDKPALGRRRQERLGQGTEKPATEATRVTVSRVEPPLLVEYEHETVHRGITRIAVETYELTPQGSRTRVEQVVDLSRANLPWWARALIGLISRIGRPVGRPDLEVLADVVRQDLERGSAAGR